MSYSVGFKLMNSDGIIWHDSDFLEDIGYTQALLKNKGVDIKIKEITQLSPYGDLYIVHDEGTYFLSIITEDKPECNKGDEDPLEKRVVVITYDHENKRAHWGCYPSIHDVEGPIMFHADLVYGELVGGNIRMHKSVLTSKSPTCEWDIICELVTELRKTKENSQ
jgi:hypothetical protein